MKIVLSIIGAIVIGIVLVVIFTSKEAVAPATTVDQSHLVTAASHMTGKSGAKVTVVEFGDYQCPACGAFFPEMKQITDAYASNPNFNFVFRNFPLPMHPNAMIGAEAAEAA